MHTFKFHVVIIDQIRVWQVFFDIWKYVVVGNTYNRSCLKDFKGTLPDVGSSVGDIVWILFCSSQSLRLFNLLCLRLLYWFGIALCALGSVSRLFFHIWCWFIRLCTIKCYLSCFWAVRQGFCSRFVFLHVWYRRNCIVSLLDSTRYRKSNC